MSDERGQSGVGHGDADAMLPIKSVEQAATALGTGADGFEMERPSTIDGGMASSSFVDAIRRSKWLILGVFAVVSVVAIPYIWMNIAPTYRSTALVRVSPVVHRIVFKTEDQGIVPLYWSYLNTQVTIIGSSIVLQRVLENEDVRQTGWYRGASQTARLDRGMPVLEKLANALEVEPQRQSELIEVSMETTDPKDARVLVDAVVDAYKRHSDETLGEVGASRLASLQEERSRLEAKIDAYTTAQYNLSKQVGSVDPEVVRAQLSETLNNLETEHDAAKREVEMTKGDLEVGAAEKANQEQQQGSGGQESPASELRYAADLEWRELDTKLLARRSELSTERQLYGEEHWRIKRMKQQVDHFAKLLRQRERQLDAQWSQDQNRIAVMPNTAFVLEDVGALKRRLERQQRDLGLRAGEINAVRSKIALAADLVQRIARVQGDLDSSRRLYNAVYARINELEMEGKAPARITIASHGMEPTLPHRDRRVRLSAVALIGSLLLGVMLALFRAQMDQKIHEIGDVQGTVRAPFLGQVPPFPNGTNLLTENDPAVIESIRMVRTALLERLGKSRNRVILITSSTSQSGKTSVAVLLARSLAFLGRKTLLVEADLRRPSIARRLNLDWKVGLAAMLSGRAQDDTAVFHSGIEGLDLLVAGDWPETFNSERLADGIFAKCLQRWRKRYDFILLDSPPVLPVADARILAGQADGTIMILRASHTRRTEVVQAYADLSAAGGTLLGTVLVGVSPGARGAYYGGYESYKRYPPALEAST